MKIGENDYWLLSFFVICFLLGLFVVLLSHAKAQEMGHRPQDMALHEQFYSTWKIPENGKERKRSCCNKVDCEPRKVKKENGVWYVWFRIQNRWLPIPENLIESNQSDPRESPDGQSHVCINPNSGMVLCAVLGSGQ
jgi:hypothetical protein